MTDFFNFPFQEKLFSNDPCIRAILAFLPIEDLANAANVSYILKINAELVFRDVHAATIELEYNAENFAKQQLVFQQFGRLAKKVKIVTRRYADDDIFHSDGDKILRTIGHFCGKNLQDLTLRCMKIDLWSTNYSVKDRNDVLDVFKSVVKLTLSHVCIKSDVNGNGLLNWTKSLEELSIHSCCPAETLLELTVLPKLKILHIGACPPCPFVVSNDFNDFLKVNPSIEELNYHFWFMGHDYLKSICALPRLTNLEVLLLECNGLSLIANARKLKQLTVHVAPEDHRQFSKLRKLLPTGCDYNIKDLQMIRHHHQRFFR